MVRTAATGLEFDIRVINACKMSVKRLNDPMTESRSVRHRRLRGAAMLSEQAWSEVGSALRVTRREVEVVQAVFDNLTEKGIASRFAITEHTAHTHLNRLFKKLNVRSRTELVLRFVEQMMELILSETAVLPPICPRHESSHCFLHRPASARDKDT
jgi:DNA-binding NarL/FixJ family response regulator